MMYCSTSMDAKIAAGRADASVWDGQLDIRGSRVSAPSALELQMSLISGPTRCAEQGD